jgi:hypothetical protein
LRQQGADEGALRLGTLLRLLRPFRRHPLIRRAPRATFPREGEGRALLSLADAGHKASDPIFKARRPSIPWKRMAAAGNVYGHDYEDMAAKYVWETVHRDLPPLRAVIEQELSQPG